MFIPLLAASFLVALSVAALTILAFRRPMAGILGQIASPEIAATWLRYMTFAMGVVGVSGGVRVWELEKYLEPKQGLVLNLDRWVLEVYGTVIGTLSSLAWLLLVFFAFTLLAYMLVRLAKRREEG